MRALSASELLQVWEQGQGRRLADSALAILDLAYPETSLDTLAELSIGQRDACLLSVRERTFGSRLVSLAYCPECGECLELVFNTAGIRVPHAELPSTPMSICVDGYEVSFRAPNSLDLIAVSDDRCVEAIRQQLLSRCITSATHGGRTESWDRLPSEIIDAIVSWMAETDPQAEIQLSLKCPSCAHEWQALFDIVSFFWSEINTWVRRILGEVHVLAAAYGWSEADILALSPWRRQLYLNMVGV